MCGVCAPACRVLRGREARVEGRRGSAEEAPATESVRFLRGADHIGATKRVERASARNEQVRSIVCELGSLSPALRLARADPVPAVASPAIGMDFSLSPALTQAAMGSLWLPLRWGACDRETSDRSNGSARIEGFLDVAYNRISYAG